MCNFTRFVDFSFKTSLIKLLLLLTKRVCHFLTIHGPWVSTLSYEFNSTWGFRQKRSKKIKENLFLFLSGLNGKCEPSLATRWYVGHSLGVPAITSYTNTQHTVLSMNNIHIHNKTQQTRLGTERSLEGLGGNLWNYWLCVCVFVGCAFSQQYVDLYTS